MELEAARAGALALMRAHGLGGWTLVLDNARTRAGVCRPQRKEIGLSRPLTQLHDEDEVRDTILHEIAHALVGPEHGHDAVWVARARAIGCSGQRCLGPDTPRIPGPWVGRCPAGHETTRHRRPARVQSCARCTSGFDPAAVLVWTWRGRAVAMLPAYDTELARIRSGSTVPPPTAPALEVGMAVRLAGAGRFGGLTGVIEKRGRSRYQVRTPRGLVSAPFALVSVLGPGRHPG